MSTTLYALTGLVAWTLFLLIVMEAVRSYLVIAGKEKANGFDPLNTTLSPFMQRLARAHANCLENLPVFATIMLTASVTGQSVITDPLAVPLLVLRVIQSGIHLYSLSAPAVTLRFCVFALQIAIAVYWVIRLLTNLIY